MKNNKDGWHRRPTKTWTTDCDNDGDDGDNGLITTDDDDGDGDGITRMVVATAVVATWGWHSRLSLWLQARWAGEPLEVLQSGGEPYRVWVSRVIPLPISLSIPCQVPPPLSSFHVPPWGAPTDFRKVSCVRGTRPSLIIIVHSTNDRRARRPSVIMSLSQLIN